MSVEIKLGTCYNNGNRCIHNGSCVCTGCGVLSGNVKKPILFKPEMKEIDLSKCKKKGNPGEQCGCQCLWMCTDKGNDKENPLPPRFIKCIFLDF